MVARENQYLAIQQLHEKKGYSILDLCKLAGTARSSYYKHQNKQPSALEQENAAITRLIIKIYSDVQGIYGYRRMTMAVNRFFKKQYNHKRIYRLMKEKKIQSVIRRKKRRYVPSIPQVTAENILNRNFTAHKPNEKWLTDITEFKLANGQRAYLSAILDLNDKSIVSYVLGASNNNALVFQTFDLAMLANPMATPLFHSDRGFQYTSKLFRNKLNQAGIVQSMSRVGRCIDNGPMEGFWGTLKSEMFYLRKFHTYDQLRQSVDEYIDFYNTKRPQKKVLNTL